LEIILLLQSCLRPFILIIISAVNWPVTFSQTLHGFTFLFHCTMQWWSLPYFTLSKSSTSLYGFLYFVLHLFLSLLSPRIYYLCKIIQHLTTIHLWSLCKFYNWGWNLTLFFHISCKPPSMIIQFVLIYYIVSDKLLKISLWHSLVFINCMYAYHH